VQHAIEHTIVEAFAGQIHTGVDFGSFIEPIAAALDHHMPPPGRFLLVFAINPSQGMKPRIAFVETKGDVQLQRGQGSACFFDPWLAWPLNGDMWVNGVKAPVQFRRRSLSKPWSAG
jgi:hypothetical protein